ncbi:MAG: DUF1385 domain-containing protein [Lachnospiraceae bacterium]|nr:DUF1385 domain-containing protein [Lachnospiraceae bacterium]
MRMSGIGGQAVLEGIMMKNGDDYALAVRLPDDQIHVEKDVYRSVAGDSPVKKAPFIRGVVAFIDSLVLGISTLMRSSTFFMDEEETGGAPEAGPGTAAASDAGRAGAEESGAPKPAKEGLSGSNKAFMFGALALSLAIAVALFVLLPLFVTNLFRRVTDSPVILAVIEGVVKVVIFLGYLLAVSRMKDIRRTFMYHGAEHKCINCVETGHELTVDHVRAASRFHKRCGTSFLFYVVIISVIIGFFIQSGSTPLRLVIRLALIPVIAGISYEFIRLAGSSDHPVVNVFAKPGLAMQKITTAEPDDSMIEVAIAAVEKVFDWRAFLAEDGSGPAGTGEET